MKTYIKVVLDVLKPKKAIFYSVVSKNKNRNNEGIELVNMNLYEIKWDLIKLDYMKNSKTREW